MRWDEWKRPSNDTSDAWREHLGTPGRNFLITEPFGGDNILLHSKSEWNRGTGFPRGGGGGPKRIGKDQLWISFQYVCHTNLTLQCRWSNELWAFFLLKIRQLLMKQLIEDDQETGEENERELMMKTTYPPALPHNLKKSQLTKSGPGGPLYIQFEIKWWHPCYVVPTYKTSQCQRPLDCVSHDGAYAGQASPDCDSVHHDQSDDDDSEREITGWRPCLQSWQWFHLQRCWWRQCWGRGRWICENQQDFMMRHCRSTAAAQLFEFFDFRTLHLTRMDITCGTGFIWLW